MEAAYTAVDSEVEGVEAFGAVRVRALRACRLTSDRQEFGLLLELVSAFGAAKLDDRRAKDERNFLASCGCLHCQLKIRHSGNDRLPIWVRESATREVTKALYRV